MWGGYLAYFDFMREVAQLPIDWSKYEPWRVLGNLTGFRFVHEEFCILSEMPIEFHVDDDNQAHCEDGPYVRWANGDCIWAIHGHMVPGLVVESPGKINLAMVDRESNAEVRRIMIDRYPGGPSQYLIDSGAELLDSDTLRLEGSGLRALLRDKSSQHWLVGTDGSTARVYHMPVPPARTCREAHELISGLIETSLICEA